MKPDLRRGYHSVQQGTNFEEFSFLGIISLTSHERNTHVAGLLQFVIQISTQLDTNLEKNAIFFACGLRANICRIIVCSVEM